jgi:antitoxin ParD1/3/4
MNVRLSPELEAIVREKVASGRYKDEQEVIADALHALSHRDDDQFQALLAAIDEGDADLAAGRYIEIKSREELHEFFKNL